MHRRIDTTIIIIAIALSLSGLLMIFSTAGLDYTLKQAIELVICLILAYLCSRISPRIWSNLSPFIYATAIILLILILFLHGVYPRRWFRIGELSIQPSEIAKFATILLLANFLAGQKKMKTFSSMIVPIIICALPALLVFVEPDLGAAQIFFPILLIMLYWAGVPAPKIFILFSPLVSAVASLSIYVWVGYIIALAIFLYFRKQLSDLIYGLVSNSFVGLLMPVLWNSLRHYQQKRIISFLSPWLDPQGMSWQIIQSKIAIGSGKFLGKGFLSGTQKKLAFLPERHTDFIFSCLGEEFGLLGIIVVTGLYLFLFYRILRLARETRNRFASIYVIGVLAWLGYQTFLNMGMTMGLLPITGVPLPFLSYGGSALISCFIAIGLCLTISRTKLEY